MNKKTEGTWRGLGENKKSKGSWGRAGLGNLGEKKRMKEDSREDVNKNKKVFEKIEA